MVSGGQKGEPMTFKGKLLVCYILLVIMFALWKLNVGYLISFGIWIKIGMTAKGLVY